MVEVDSVRSHANVGGLIWLTLRRARYFAYWVRGKPASRAACGRAGMRTWRHTKAGGAPCEPALHLPWSPLVRQPHSRYSQSAVKLCTRFVELEGELEHVERGDDERDDDGALSRLRGAQHLPGNRTRQPRKENGRAPCDAAQHTGCREGRGGGGGGGGEMLVGLTAGRQASGGAGWCVACGVAGTGKGGSGPSGGCEAASLAMATRW